MNTPWQAGGAEGDRIELDKTPTGEEEEEEYFSTPEEKEWHRHLNKKLELENAQFERDMKNREEFANKSFWITATWIVFILLISELQFAYAKTDSIGLTEKEFIVLITTTTASTFGFWLLVGRYLFHRDVPKKGSSKFPKAPGNSKRKKSQRKPRGPSVP